MKRSHRGQKPSKPFPPDQILATLKFIEKHCPPKSCLKKFDSAYCDKLARYINDECKTRLDGKKAFERFLTIKFNHKHVSTAIDMLTLTLNVESVFVKFEEIEDSVKNENDCKVEHPNDLISVSAVDLPSSSLTDSTLNDVENATNNSHNIANDSINATNNSRNIANDSLNAFANGSLISSTYGFTSELDAGLGFAEDITTSSFSTLTGNDSVKDLSDGFVRDLAKSPYMFSGSMITVGNCFGDEFANDASEYLYGNDMPVDIQFSQQMTPNNANPSANTLSDYHANARFTSCECQTGYAQGVSSECQTGYAQGVSSECQTGYAQGFSSECQTDNTNGVSSGSQIDYSPSVSNGSQTDLLITNQFFRLEQEKLRLLELAISRGLSVDEARGFLDLLG
jgi:hypothetical protein